MPPFQISDGFNGQSERPGLNFRNQGMLLSVLLGAGFILAAILHYLLAGLDQQIELWIFAESAKVSHSLLNKITLMGDALLLAPISLMFIAWWAGKKEWDKAGGLALSVFGGGLLTLLLKLVFHAPRPNLVTGWVNPLDFGFPSGHAVMSILFWGFWACTLMRAEPRQGLRQVIGVIAACIILAVGLTRLMLGVHYPVDILGGWMFGAMWLVLSIRMVNPLTAQKAEIAKLYRVLKT